MNQPIAAQTPPSSTWTPLRLTFALLLVAAAICFAYLQIFSLMNDYDDEGYMLMSFSHYLRDGGLYTKTFAQYGPFYFYIQQVMHTVLLLPVNHNGGRVLTLFWWLLSSSLSAYCAFRLTRDKILSAFVFFATTLLALVLSQEPGHPQEIVLPLLQAALVACLLLSGVRKAAGLFFLGAITAALLLTKINVGVFMVLGVLLGAAGAIQKGTIRTILLTLVTIASLTAPFYLMRLYWTLWAQRYCLLSTACLFVVCIFVWRLPISDRIAPKSLLPLLTGFLSVFASICLIATAQGVTPSSLLDGVLLRPMQHPGVFSIPFRFPWPQVAFASIALFGVLILSWRRELCVQYANQIAWAKTIFGAVALILLAVHWLRTMMFVESMLALLLIRTDGNQWKLNQLWPRLFICSITAFQVLQPYPVSGSQVAIAMSTGIVWAVVLLSDGVDSLRPDALSNSRWKIIAASVALVLIMTTGGLRRFQDAVVGFSQPSSGLPGTEWVHVKSERSQNLRTLIAAIRRDCTVLFTAPGMESLNLWSNTPTPNGMNLTGWMTSFHTGEQHEIVNLLRSSDKPCVVVNRALLGFWLPYGQQILLSSPIMQYADHELRLKGEFDNYELRTNVAHSEP